jgi:hypothetical protein
MILFKKIILIILIINSSCLFAQELNFTVTVANPQARATDPKVFKALETSIRDFLNNTKWTEDVFETQERLTGNILLRRRARFMAAMRVPRFWCIWIKIFRLRMNNFNRFNMLKIFLMII